MNARIPVALSWILFCCACTSADEPMTSPPPGSGAATVKSEPFPAQEGWVTETPTSAIRKAQFKLPKQGADTEDATVVVFYFGGQGGSVQDNVDRWANEYEQPDGRPSTEVVKQSSRKVNGMNVVEVDVSGTRIAETSPGSGQRVRKENWRTLAAIIETGHGAYYAKLTGPIGTVAHWESSFRRFVSEAKPTAN